MDIHKLSNVATLQSLDVSPIGGGLVQRSSGGPFDSNVTSYNLLCDAQASDLVFTSVATSSFATQRYKFGGSGPLIGPVAGTPPGTVTHTFVAVPVGLATNVSITVFADDGTQKTYQVSVTKKGQ